MSAGLKSLSATLAFGAVMVFGAVGASGLQGIAAF